ncbi:inorganic diphosphatase [Patescibacteria group bacterium]
MKQSNLVHTLPTGERPPYEVNCLVEIPKGSSNKYEYDKDFGLFKLDRVLYEAVFYPAEYGIIPQTLEDDGDPLDIMVLSTYPTFPGCLISCRPIAALRLDDSGEEDNKIIAVPADDPRFKEVKNIDDLRSHIKKEIKNFWENYVELQPNKIIEIKGWSGREKARQLIEQAIIAYQKSLKKQ